MTTHPTSEGSDPLDRITWPVHTRRLNGPSLALLERVGMRPEQRTVRDSLHRSGAWLDGVGYALLAEEWRGPTH